MEIILAKSAGFCFGVKRAIDMVYNEAVNENVYTYGPIIHNEEVVKDLENKGVKVIEEGDDLKSIKNGTIIIRSHGITQDEFTKLKETGCKIVDATCPFVLKIHKIVKEASARGEYVVIVGNKDHPEVVGIKSWAGEDSIVIGNTEDALKFVDSELGKDKKICMVSQTTFNYNKFQELVEIIEKKRYNVSVLNTICNATEERQGEARKISAEVDAMIVIGGRKSSNTQKLYEICKNECDNTFYIQTAADMDFSSISGVGRIGITAGASTPKKIIEEVQTKCQN